MSSFLWRLRATCGYRLARFLFRWQALIRQPRVWRWMEGQFARLARLGDAEAQDFYGHLLLFRGQGQGAREEGLRLLRQAAAQGRSKAAFQLGVQAFKGSLRQAPDAGEALHWWKLAAEGGHPLAARRLADLLREGAPGVPADPEQAERFNRRASELGL